MITANITSFLVLQALLILFHLTLYYYPPFKDELSERHMTDGWKSLVWNLDLLCAKALAPNIHDNDSRHERLCSSLPGLCILNKAY